MDLKLNRDFFYDKKRVKTAKLVITILVLISNVAFFLLIPIGGIFAAKKELKELKRKEVTLNQTLVIATKTKLKFEKMLKEKQEKQEELVNLLKSRSFINVVDFEKTFQQILDKLGIDTLSISKNYLSKENSVDGTQRILTDFNLIGDGLKIAELYDLIENSNELMSVRDSKFNVVKEDTTKLETALTVDYYMLDNNPDVQLVNSTNDERLNQIIKDYNQKKNIFKENVEKKKIVVKKRNNKIDYAKKYRRKFELVGIVTTNNASSAVIYYNSSKKGLIRLVVSRNKTLVLDGRKFDIEVSSTTATIKTNGKLITRLHDSK